MRNAVGILEIVLKIFLIFAEHVKKHFHEGETLDHEVHAATATTPQSEEESPVKPENVEELEQNELMKEETVDDQAQPTFSYTENSMETEMIDVVGLDEDPLVS